MQGINMCRPLDEGRGCHAHVPCLLLACPASHRQLKQHAWSRYFSENSSQLPGILANVLSGYFNNSNLKSSPLIVTEYGR